MRSSSGKSTRRSSGTMTCSSASRRPPPIPTTCTSCGGCRTWCGSPRPAGFGFRGPRLAVRGRDLAGVVEAVGGRVTQLRPGDEVFGVGRGTFAGYACASERELAPKPANLTFVQAAAMPVAGVTALRAIRDHGRVQPGQTVLINGAAGGVGTFAVQIANAFGAEATGVCSTRNVEMVRSIGADHVIDYTAEDFTRGSKRYDLILDLVGNHSVSACRRALAPDGMLLLSHGGRSNWFGPMGQILRATRDVQVHEPEAARVHGARHERGPGRSQGARRGREGHAGHRSDLSAEREPGRDRAISKPDTPEARSSSRSRSSTHEPASQPRPTAASDRPHRHRHHDRHLGPRRVRLDGQQDQLDRRHRQRLLRGQDRRDRQVRWAVRRQPDGDRPGRRHRRDRRGGCGRSGRQHPPRSRVERRDEHARHDRRSPARRRPGSPTRTTFHYAQGRALTAERRRLRSWPSSAPTSPASWA